MRNLPIAPAIFPTNPELDEPVPTGELTANTPRLLVSAVSCLGYWANDARLVNRNAHRYWYGVRWRL